MKNIFDKEVSDEVIARIKKLTPQTLAQWGKMTVGQMLAHCCVTYEMVFEDSHPKATGFKKLMLKLFVKGVVTNEKPYAKNSRTAPQFIITDPREFDKEKSRLIAYLNRVQALGEKHFEEKESNSFGKLTAVEWNNSFYKHLDHHLTQFGV